MRLDIQDNIHVSLVSQTYYMETMGQGHEISVSQCSDNDIRIYHELFDK
jgi:hypothetical protein